MVQAVAEPTSVQPSPTPGASPGGVPTGQPAPSDPPPQGVAGQSNIQAEIKETLMRADDRIAAASSKAGLGTPRIETHVDRVKTAVTAYKTLVSQGKAQDAEAFLKDMTGIGNKFGLNFGLSSTPKPGEPEGKALNADRFKGVDMQDAYYKEQQRLYGTLPQPAKPTGTPDKPQAAAQPDPGKASAVPVVDPGGSTPLQPEQAQLTEITNLVAQYLMTVDKGDAAQGDGSLRKSEIDAALSKLDPNEADSKDKATILQLLSDAMKGKDGGAGIHESAQFVVDAILQSQSQASQTPAAAR